MKLRARMLVTAVLVAIPIAFASHLAIETIRERDMRVQLDRFVISQLTDDTRDRCDANANWFLAGPRPDRPTPQQLAAPDADVTAPRPPTQEQPLEFFAFDDGFLPLSTAGPRFPAELRQALRAGARTAVSSFRTREGTGLQEAVTTGWSGSPCAVLLFRMRAVPNQVRDRTLVLVSLAALLFGAALATGVPIVARVRRLAAEARRSADDEYRSAVNVSGRDELGAIAFAFNEAGADIRRRATDVKDREDSLRRFIGAVTDGLSGPLLSLEQRMSALSDPAAVTEAHTLNMRLQNLAAAARLKMSMATSPSAAVDLDGLIERVVERQSSFARAMRVEIAVAAAAGPLRTNTDGALLEQAVNNLVDNAIRYNRPGGHVAISLDRTRDGRFSLRVEDDGPGAPDEVLAKLNANRRFRGDEGRTREPGELGLGLAIVREAGDRLGIKWVFRRSARGWFEAELTGALTS